MNSFVFKKMGSARELQEGVFSLFGFAVTDYTEKYGETDGYIFGAVLDHGDVTDDLLAFIEAATDNREIKMLIFDIIDASVGDIKCLGRINGINDFEELLGVYEDRIVFARK